MTDDERREKLLEEVETLRRVARDLRHGRMLWDAIQLEKRADEKEAMADELLRPQEEERKNG